MRLPWMRRSEHDEIVLDMLEDFALERAQLERAHADALDRYRGRMRPAAREAADAREADGVPCRCGGKPPHMHHSGLGYLRHGDDMKATYPGAYE